MCASKRPCALERRYCASLFCLRIVSILSISGDGGVVACLVSWGHTRNHRAREFFDCPLSFLWMLHVHRFMHDGREHILRTVRVWRDALETLVAVFLLVDGDGSLI